MWFRNKETGLVWEVEGELAERLSQSDIFEEVAPPCQSQSESTATSTSQVQTNISTTDFSQTLGQTQQSQTKKKRSNKRQEK